MRHLKNKKTLDRTTASRSALLRGMATNFVLYEKIKTTDAKAKVVRSIVERYITLAKKGDRRTSRELKKYFYTDGAVKKLMEDIAPRYKERHGGYTRMTKLGPRLGDHAAMVQLELV
ncbi:50S ribosomal protein L17 [Candidatus Falkowbacteria bacterium]|nr:50S ribosomal protein L17 [Candidatus Falkowbacteria bacterium]